MAHLTSQPSRLVSVLLDSSAALGDRHDAAMDLGEFDEAEAALLQVVLNLAEDPDIADAAGESLWSIWSRAGKNDLLLAQSFHPEARKFFPDTCALQLAQAGGAPPTESIQASVPPGARSMPERDRIIAIFQARRKVPGADYDPEHFLDYLINQPKSKGAFYNSFAGLRRFNAFIDQVQMEFAICFSVKDREANYSLDRFVARTGDLRESPRSSLASLKNRMKSGTEWNIIVVSNVCLAVPAVAFRRILIILGAILAAATIMNAFWFWFYRSEKRYSARLHQRIMAASRGEN